MTPAICASLEMFCPKKMTEAYDTPTLDVPLIRRKVEQVLARADKPAGAAEPLAVTRTAAWPPAAAARPVPSPSPSPSP